MAQGLCHLQFAKLLRLLLGQGNTSHNTKSIIKNLDPNLPTQLHPLPLQRAIQKTHQPKVSICENISRTPPTTTLFSQIENFQKCQNFQKIFSQTVTGTLVVEISSSHKLFQNMLSVVIGFRKPISIGVGGNWCPRIMFKSEKWCVCPVRYNNLIY